MVIYMSKVLAACEMSGAIVSAFHDSVKGSVKRSLTFPGIASAMASQWSHLL